MNRVGRGCWGAARLLTRSFQAAVAWLVLVSHVLALGAGPVAAAVVVGTGPPPQTRVFLSSVVLIL